MYGTPSGILRASNCGYGRAFHRHVHPRHGCDSRRRLVPNQLGLHERRRELSDQSRRRTPSSSATRASFTQNAKVSMKVPKGSPRDSTNLKAKQPDTVMLSCPFSVQIKKCWQTFLSTTAVRCRNKNGHAAKLVYQTLPCHRQHRELRRGQKRHYYNVALELYSGRLMSQLPSIKGMWQQQRTNRALPPRLAYRRQRVWCGRHEAVVLLSGISLSRALRSLQRQWLLDLTSYGAAARGKILATSIQERHQRQERWLDPTILTDDRAIVIFKDYNARDVKEVPVRS